MSCRACEDDPISGTYFRWRNANIEIVGCRGHVKEVIDALRSAHAEASSQTPGHNQALAEAVEEMLEIGSVEPNSGAFWVDECYVRDIRQALSALSGTEASSAPRAARWGELVDLMMDSKDTRYKAMADALLAKFDICHKKGGNDGL